ncbi:MAG: signal peptide peptidase SppA [Oricola sp.]
MSDHFADNIIDRRRLRRKLTFWRVVAVCVAVIALFAAAYASFPEDRFGAKSRPHIAKVRIDGTIFEDEELLSVLKDIGESEAVKGVILTVDSPGGTTAGGEAIFDAVRKIAAEKPVTAQVGTLAASAGYLIASAADHIVARKTSIVGSIGVLVQYPNFATLLDNLGVDVRTIKSSPLKAEPGMFDESPPGAEDMIRRMILDSYAWFKDLVKDRRGLSDAEIATLADGSVFTGRQALDRKLIDGLGGEEAAKEWLASKGVDADLDVIEWKKSEPAANLLWAKAAIQWLGIDLGKNSPLESVKDRLFLDGLVSVWHVGH